MATKPKAPALRNAGNELGSISSQSTTAFNERSPMLLGSLTSGARDLSNTATQARLRELGRMQQFINSNVGPTRSAVSAEYGAIADRLGTPTGMERQMTDEASLAMVNPAARNAVLGQLQQQALDGGSPLLRELEGQALTDVRLGRALSPEQEMQAQQAARAAGAARGMVLGAPTATAEVLNRDAFATAREAQRRGFGMDVERLGTGYRMGVAGMYQGALDSGRNFALGTNAQTLDRERMRAAAASERAGFNWTSDPGVMALGQPSMVPMSMQAALQTNQQADVYPQVMNYMGDLYNTNFNARESRYNSAINRYYATQNANVGARPGGFNVGGGVTGALSGAASGAMLGSVAGPWGTAIGAVAGGVLGGTMGSGVLGSETAQYGGAALQAAGSLAGSYGSYQALGNPVGHTIGSVQYATGTVPRATAASAM